MARRRARRPVKTPAKAKTKEEGGARSGGSGSAALPRALDEATRAIRGLTRTAGETFHELGKWFARVRDEGLFRARHETFEDYLENEVDYDRTLAYRFIRIAETFTPETAARHGATKLDAYLRLIDATPADEPAAAVRDLAVKVPVVARRSGEPSRSKPLAEASSREVLAAARAARAAGGRAKTPGSRLPAAVAKRLEAAAGALEQAGLLGTRLQATPTAERGAGGASLVLSGLAVARAARAFKVLARVFGG
jgi:hypothetical protein